MRLNILKGTFTVIASVAVVSTAPAIAGEIKGPPPSQNYTADELDMHSNSLCAFSGLNDSPEGDPHEGDPGGIAQSFGYFFGKGGYPISDLDPRSDFLSPGYSCNPSGNRGPRLRG